MLDDIDKLYIRDASETDLKEEKQYTHDVEYREAIDTELKRRKRTALKSGD
jgi:hypothetical protein